MESRRHAGSAGLMSLLMQAYAFLMVTVAQLELLGMIRVVTSAPAEDLITSLPGQPAVTFKQYGGFVTVDAEKGRALYYYFAEAESNAGSRPLTLWLNGGPGCSSLGGGAFTELGPFYTLRTSLQRNGKAWNRVSNVLFVESPAGVGFSYSNTTSDYDTGDARTARDSLVFLVEWFKKFPEYQDRDFFITGESYAGHYAPQLAAEVLEHNAIAGQAQIRLKGLMVGNPLFDLVIDTVYSAIVFQWSHGLISEETYNQINKLCKLDEAYESGACKHAINNSTAESGLSGPVNAYDVLADICVADVSAAEARRLKNLVNHFLKTDFDAQVSPCIEDQESSYLNMPEVQTALHAREMNWSICSDVLEYKYNDLSIPMVPVLTSLLRKGLRLWVFRREYVLSLNVSDNHLPFRIQGRRWQNGDQDSVISLVGTRKIVGQVARELNQNSTSSYRVWFEGHQVGGWTTSWGNLTYATVRGAGHMVPATQPSRALQLFTSFLSGTTLPSVS